MNIILISVCFSFRDRLFAVAGPNTFKQLIRGCKTYLDALCKEATLRETQEVLDVEAYTALRRENSAVRPTLSIANVALNIDPLDELLEDPIFMSMHNATVDMVAWTNVIYFAGHSVLVVHLLFYPGHLLLRYGTSQGSSRKQHPDRLDEGAQHWLTSSG